MAKVHKPAPAKVLRLPITNVLAGTYSAEVSIGGAGKLASLVLDTGSATLAVESSVYDGSGDASLKATSLAQLITYGGGGFAGPVVTTDIGLGGAVLKGVSMAIAVVQQGSLGQAGGVIGLAYGGLNPGWDFAPYFAARSLPASTWPWPFGTPLLAQLQTELENVVQAGGADQTTITPFFDQLANQRLAANNFAFWTLRSAPSARMGGDPAAQAKDPVNNGVFVLGGGDQETDLFEGDFQTVLVVHKLFYNVSLVSVRVGAGEAQPARVVTPQDPLISNALIDTGNDKLKLASEVLQAVITGLGDAHPSFAAVIGQAQTGEPVPTDALDLAAWPDVVFAFAGAGGAPVELTVTPQTYWQTDSPAPGQASFRIEGPVTEGQSNFGLPLMNNYYTVFDRSSGVVRFAPIKTPG